MSTIMMTPEFKGFPKIPRFGKFYVTITEKIDGTNAGVFITDDEAVIAASRNRWITPGADNYGFAQWAEDHAVSLRLLGPGMHWGEWWGQGIQRRYDLTEKRFSLFDVYRWSPHFHREDSHPIHPVCCHVVPVLGILHEFSDDLVGWSLDRLKLEGSHAAPGYMDPEGVVIAHNIKQPLYKLTFDNAHKGEQTA